MIRHRRKYIRDTLIRELCRLFLIYLGFLCIPGSLQASVQNDYAGAEACRKCHEKQYEAWKATGHAQILRKSSDKRIKYFPSGYSRQEISYVIGGNKWKTLFLDSKGYIITSTSAGKGRNQYNIKSGRWVDYHPGETIHYDCGRCHTTGFSPEGHQEGYDGIQGTWKFEGVQCEACHGPGYKHSLSLSKDDISIDREGCYRCHGTQPLDEITLDGIFLSQYTEANQLKQSSMKILQCISCHDPHSSSKTSIKESCEACHQETAGIYKGSFKYKKGITCVDCHMPPAVMIAEGDPETYSGDFRSHLFRIDHQTQFPVLEKNGRRLNPGYLSVDYACIPCHHIYRDRQWAVNFAMAAHRIQITSNIKIMRLQVWMLYVGFLAALIALLAGLHLKNIFLKTIDLDKKNILTYHRLFAWTSFSIFVFNSIVCTYFHFPLDDMPKALGYGWFLIHPLNGILGLFMYGGKIYAVRKLKKGWKIYGLAWGTGIFIFWLIQFMTVVLK